MAVKVGGRRGAHRARAGGGGCEWGEAHRLRLDAPTASAHAEPRAALSTATFSRALEAKLRSGATSRHERHRRGRGGCVVQGEAHPNVALRTAPPLPLPTSQSQATLMHESHPSLLAPQWRSIVEASHVPFFFRWSGLFVCSKMGSRLFLAGSGSVVRNGVRVRARVRVGAGARAKVAGSGHTLLVVHVVRRGGVDEILRGHHGHGSIHAQPVPAKQGAVRRWGLHHGTGRGRRGGEGGRVRSAHLMKKFSKITRMAGGFMLTKSIQRSTHGP